MRSLIDLQDLANNPTARIPICICLDTSGSMSRIISGHVRKTGESILRDGEYWQVVTGGTTAIEALNQGLSQFYDEIYADEIAKYSADICIITFGGNQPKIVSDFINIEQRNNMPKLKASGQTPMGEAVNMALDCLEKRKEEYRSCGVDYYQPWLVIMTDGINNGDKSEFEYAVQRTTELIQKHKLTIFPIIIPTGVPEIEQEALNTLKHLSPNRTPLKMGKDKFGQFFQWLSQSVVRTSQSVPGDMIALPPPDWSEI